MFDPPYGKPWLLYGILGGSLALNVISFIDGQEGSEDPATTLAATGDSSETAQIATPAPGYPSVQPSTDATAFAATPAVSPTPPPPAPILDGEWRTINTEVRHSMARTFQRSVGDSGDALSAVFARLFVWDFDLRRDLMAGDQVEGIWRENDESKVEIAAARLHSTKDGHSYTAYRWHAPGDTFASWWQEDGTEASFRLQNAPMRDYEQITALLKDGRNHKGMDFKAPVGTQALSPYNGVVTRVNWNTYSNGNCLEIKFNDGVVAKYLHLSDVKVKPGQGI